MGHQNFDAGDDVLTYDFTKYSQGKGEIPEPSSRQIETFIEVLRQILPLKADDNGKQVVDADKFTESVEQGSDVEATLFAAVAAVTSDEVSVAKLSALPFRVQRRFLGWFMGVMLSPEA